MRTRDPSGRCSSPCPSSPCSSSPARAPPGAERPARRAAAPAGAAARDLQGAGRDQHHRLRRRQHAGGGGHGRPAAGRGLPAPPTCRSWAPRRARATWSPACAAPARGQPLLLLAHLDVVEARREDWSVDPVHAPRAGRLLLRARHQRRQGHGRDLRREPDPLQAGGLRARPRPHRGADRRRGGRRPQRRRAGCWPSTARSIDAALALNEGGGGAIKDGKYARQQRPGEREGLPELSARGEEHGRAQLAARQGQRDLPPGRRADAAGRVRLPRASSTRSTARSSSARAAHTGGPLGRRHAAVRDGPAIPPPWRAWPRRALSSTRGCGRRAWRRGSRAATPTTRCRRRPRAVVNCRDAARRDARRTCAGRSSASWPTTRSR